MLLRDQGPSRTCNESKEEKKKKVYQASLKYEPASEPLQISVKWLFWRVYWRIIAHGGRRCLTAARVRARDRRGRGREKEIKRENERGPR